VYIALAAAVIIVAIALFVPYRPVSESAYNRVRCGAFFMLVVPAGWAALVVFDIDRGESFLRDLILAASTAFAGVYFLARVLRQDRPKSRT
jgi:hypothetical protein